MQATKKNIQKKYKKKYIKSIKININKKIFENIRKHFKVTGSKFYWCNFFSKIKQNLFCLCLCSKGKMVKCLWNEERQKLDLHPVVRGGENLFIFLL